MRERLSLAPHLEPVGEQIWAYYDTYKRSGKGDAVARPKMASFHHLSEESRLRDEALLTQKMSKPFLRQQNEHGPDAFAFENFLTTETMHHCWLGGEASPTTAYDDWVSGVDAVVEWKDEHGEPIRLAIDFTSTENFKTFYKKSDKLEGSIRVKYLRSTVETENGQPKELKATMPVVILGFDKQIFRHIAEEKAPLRHDHPLRLLLLDQARAQIDLQITQLLQKTFEATRIKRAKGNGMVQEQFASLGPNVTADQAIHFFNGLDAHLQTLVLNEKDMQRFQDLCRVRAQLRKEFDQAQNIPISDSWRGLQQQSKTHQILSG